MITDTAYRELVGELLTFTFKTDHLLTSLGLPYVDWIVEDCEVFDIAIDSGNHIGFEVAENNDIILDKDNDEHQRIIMEAFYDAYEVGTSRAWFDLLKNIIEKCFFTCSDVDGHEGIVSVDVGYDDTKIVVNRDVILITIDDLASYECDTEDDCIKEQVEFIPYDWIEREYWIKNHYVDWVWSEEDFISFLKERVEEETEGDV